MKTSVVMTTFNRPEFLYFSIRSFRDQLRKIDHELIVVNDGSRRAETEEILRDSDCAEGLNVRHIHTGVRLDSYWRVMGMAANIGIRQAAGEIIILTNSDIYHHGNTVIPVVANCAKCPRSLSTIQSVYDDDGGLIRSLAEDPEDYLAHQAECRRIRLAPHPKGFYPANPHVPFFLAVRREHLLMIGGFDEDFIGVAVEDCDLINRLKMIGCSFVYSRQSSAFAIHLYHGRKSIAELQALPGFGHNLRLSKVRRKQIVRNEGRDWGKLPVFDMPKESAPMSLVVWATSRCNLTCPLCSQRPAIEASPNYEMKLEELETLIGTCKIRGIKFHAVTLTGGEPATWSHLREALERIQRSGIAHSVSFITNGYDSKHTALMANSLNLYYVVSKTQATPEQIANHERHGVGVLWNTEPHRVVPNAPLDDTLPASCTQLHARDGQATRELLYSRGRIWMCCTAEANALRLGMQDDPTLSCKLGEDFDAKFKDRDFNHPICAICTSNAKVWGRLSCE